MVLILNSCRVSAISGGRVNQLLNWFKNKQQRMFSFNRENHCRAADLPLMEYTHYTCLDAVDLDDPTAVAAWEQTQLHDVQCGYTCRAYTDAERTFEDGSVIDATLFAGSEAAMNHQHHATCICEDQTGDGTGIWKCRWRFEHPDENPSPANTGEILKWYGTPTCGDKRVAFVDTKLVDVNTTADGTVDGNITEITAGNDALLAQVTVLNQNFTAELANITEKYDTALLQVNTWAAEADMNRTKYEDEIAAFAAESRANDTTQEGDRLANFNALTMATEQDNNHNATLEAYATMIANNTAAITAYNATRDAYVTKEGNKFADTNARYNGNFTLWANDTDDLQARSDQLLADWNGNNTRQTNDIANITDMLNQQIFDGQILDINLTYHASSFANMWDSVRNHTANIAFLADEIERMDTLHRAHVEFTVHAMVSQISALAANLEGALGRANDSDIFNHTVMLDEVMELMADIDERAMANVSLAATIADLQNIVADAIQSGADMATTVADTLAKLALYENTTFVGEKDAMEQRITDLLDALVLADADASTAKGGMITTLNDELAAVDTNMADNKALVSDVQDAHMDRMDANQTTLFAAMVAAEYRLRETYRDMAATDGTMQKQMDSDRATIEQMLMDLDEELSAFDDWLRSVDEANRASHTQTVADLAAEVAKGLWQDAELLDHGARLNASEDALVAMQTYLDNTNAELIATFTTLNNTLNQTEENIYTDLDTIILALMDQDNVTMNWFNANNDKLDTTNNNLAAESNRSDGHDDFLAEIEANITVNEAAMDATDDLIKEVQANVSSVFDGAGDSLDFVEGSVEALIAEFKVNMTAEDERIDDRIDDARRNLTNTNRALAFQVAAGELHDKRIAANTDSCLAINSSIMTNAETLAGIDEKRLIVWQNILHNITITYEGIGVEQVEELESKLTAVDNALNKTNADIRDEMATQKLILETRITTELTDLDTAIRTHLDDEIFKMDSKFTTSINALAAKQNVDVNDIHAALDFFWGVYRPIKLTLIDGEYQPLPGHLIAVVPFVYRIWHLEVEIMPYDKNHFSWVNLLHFTASGENFGHAGDRMPLISLYPGENKLHIASYVNNDASFAFDSSHKMQKNSWTKLEVGQTYLQGQYVYYIKIDGKQHFSVVNQYPRDFTDMMVYACDPWSEKPNAKLRNLFYTTTWSPHIVTNIHPTSPFRMEDGEGRALPFDIVNPTGLDAAVSE